MNLYYRYQEKIRELKDKIIKATKDFEDKTGVILLGMDVDIIHHSSRGRIDTSMINEINIQTNMDKESNANKINTTDNL